MGKEEKEVKTQKSILAEASALVDGDRQEQYGSPAENMRDIADLATKMIGHEFTAYEIAIIMLCVKLGRLKYQWKRDTAVDACGYLEIASRCKETEK